MSVREKVLGAETRWLMGRVMAGDFLGCARNAPPCSRSETTSAASRCSKPMIPWPAIPTRSSSDSPASRNPADDVRGPDGREHD